MIYLRLNIFQRYSGLNAVSSEGSTVLVIKMIVIAELIPPIYQQAVEIFLSRSMR
jgi:hypothetical protein